MTQVIFAMNLICHNLGTSCADFNVVSAAFLPALSLLAASLIEIFLSLFFTRVDRRNLYHFGSISFAVATLLVGASS